MLAVQADYDGFFLTPAEGDAAYSLLGHVHDRLKVGGVDKLVAISTSVLEARGNIVGSNPPVDTDNGTNSFAFTNSDDTVLWGTIDFGSGAFGGLTSEVRGQNVRWRATKALGGSATVISADPDAGVALAFNGGERFTTLDAGIRVSRAATGASVFIEESAAAAADVTGDGQFWVRTDATPMFTGDGGVDIDLSASGAVDSVFGRTGAVVALLADYNSFFLTPAEGDAAYSLLGHLHDGIADANLLDKSATEDIPGLHRYTGVDTNPGTLKSSLSRNMLHIDGKEAIDGNDLWLRINQNQDFSSGIYTPLKMRADGGFEVDGSQTRSPTGVPLKSGLGVAYWITAGQTVCKMTISTAAASGGANGDIHFRY